MSRAGSARRIGSPATIAAWCRRAPVSMGMIVVTVALSAGPVVSPSVSSALLGLTAYHAVDLGKGRVWRLVLSGFAAQSGAQFVWTVLMLMTVFVAVERVVGSVGVLLIPSAPMSSRHWRSMASPTAGIGTRGCRRSTSGRPA